MQRLVRSYLVVSSALTVLGCEAVVGNAPLRPGEAEVTGGACGARGLALPLLRITRDEYANTAQRVLGVDVTSLDAELPPDDEVEGFVSNSVSRVDQDVAFQYLATAEAIADAIDVDALLRCDPASAECWDAFLDEVALPLRRGRLDDDDALALRELRDAALEDGSANDALREVLVALLLSPDFLYAIEESETLGAISVANRLASALWNALPDRRLLEVAASGALRTAADVEREVDTMISDPRFDDAVRAFHEQWLGIDDLRRVDRSATIHPDFETTRRAALEEHHALVAHVFARSTPTFEALLTERSIHLPPEALASVYGLSAEQAMPRERAGILTRAAFLSASESGDRLAVPIHRGVVLLERVLCAPVGLAPDNVADLAGSVDLSASTRQQLAQHQTDPSCARCHAHIDPLGLAFLHYDEVGRWREDDYGAAIDPSGTIELDGSDVRFDDAPALAEALARSETAQRCYVRQWLRWATRGYDDRRSQSEADECVVDRAVAALQANGDLRAGIRAVVADPVFALAR